MLASIQDWKVSIQQEGKAYGLSRRSEKSKADAAKPARVFRQIDEDLAVG
jgi:hypothetical protein